MAQLTTTTFDPLSPINEDPLNIDVANSLSLHHEASHGRGDKVTFAASPRKAKSTTIDHHRHSEKLSLNFPILPPKPYDERQPLPSPVYSTPTDSGRSSPRLREVPASPKESNTFLTELAAQERKVLELREELQRAERDLVNLKKQWASHEANKKKRESRRIEALQPLTGPILYSQSEGEDTAPSNRASLQKQRAQSVRKPQGRVFSSSKHARALSLLSPAADDKATQDHNLGEALNESDSRMKSESRKENLSSSSAVTGRQLSSESIPLSQKATDRRSMPPAVKADSLTTAGKQMANDLRSGLWTFFEDIRQATVGEEGVTGNHSRLTTNDDTPKPLKRSQTAGSKSKAAETLAAKLPLGRSAQTRENSFDAKNTSFWKEFGVDTPKQNGRSDHLADNITPRTHGRPAVLIDIDDEWGEWDSPSASRPKSRDSENLKMHDGSLNWPELKKMTPSKLTRTVSDLMRDWDRPPAEQKKDSGLDDVLSSPHV